MIIYTIGFTKTTAQHFFSRMQQAGVNSVVDVRLKADSQLAGFAKRQDLGFFVKELLGVPYRQELLLAPLGEHLAAYRKGDLPWDCYESLYLEELARRQVESRIHPEDLDGACLLCSEATPHRCHRRSAAEYLASRWGGDVDIVHL